MAYYEKYKKMNGFSFFVGLRYTLSRKQSHLVAFISRVSTFGMILAVSILITVLSVMNGFDKELREKILAIVPHATLAAYGGTTQWQQAVTIAKQQPHILDAAPFSYLQGLIMSSAKVKPIFFYGIDPAFEQEHSFLRHLLGNALMESLLQERSLVLGEKLAKKLHLSVGDSVQVIVPSVESSEVPTMDSFIVIGLYESGTELDEKLVITYRKNIALLAHQNPESVDGIRIVVDDLFRAGSIARQLAEKTQLMQVKDWSRTHGNLYQAVQMSRRMVTLLVFIIIAVAAFNVISTLVLAVNDKARDIAILRTLGANSRQILLIFISQGALIGFIGVSVGIVLGLLFSEFISSGISVLEHVLNYQFLKTDVYPIDHLPSDIRWLDVLLVAVVAFTLSVLATIVPAWLASRVDPAKVLRYE